MYKWKYHYFSIERVSGSRDDKIPCHNIPPVAPGIESTSDYNTLIPISLRVK